MNEKKIICVACNEDGFGPSAFAYYLVRAIIDEWRRQKKDQFSFGLKVFVLNNSAYDFNKSIYFNYPEVIPVRLNRDSLIRLEKTNGEVAVKETLRKLSNYNAVRQEYLNEVTPYLYGADVAIDIGVPLFVSSAVQLGIDNRITLFDHSWAETLRLISSKNWRHIYKYNPAPTDDDSQKADEIADRIERDESQATIVYIFESYITPKPFSDYWEKVKSLNSFQLIKLKGVLGSRIAPQDARAKLNKLLTELGQKPVLENQKLVLISPGGTPVWTHLLPNMIHQFISSKEEREYIPVISNPVAPDKQTLDALKKQMTKSDRIRWFEFVKGGTQQIIMPAFDLIVTRAGGGTVNDALASRTPFVCVEEPQVQIILIENECIRQGFIPEIPEIPETRLDVFRENPVGCIDVFFKNSSKNPRICRTIKNEAEKLPAHEILEMLINSHSKTF